MLNESKDTGTKISRGDYAVTTPLQMYSTHRSLMDNPQAAPMPCVPPEIRCKILSKLSDLGSLHQAVHAAPTFYNASKNGA